MMIRTISISKKLKVLGLLAINTNLLHGSKQPTKTPRQTAKTKPITKDNKTQKSSASANKTTPQMTVEVYLNGKPITVQVSNIFKSCAACESYYLKLSMGEIMEYVVTKMAESMKEKGLPEGQIQSTIDMLKQQKDELLNNMESSAESEKVKIIDKYKQLLITSPLFAMVICLTLLLNSLRVSDKKLDATITKLMDELRHETHSSIKISMNHIAAYTYAVMMQQAGGGEPVNAEDINNMTTTLMAQRLSELQDILRSLEALKKFLLEHYGNAMNSVELNYVVINGQSYSIIQLIDEIIGQIQQQSTNTTVNQDPDNIIDILLLILSGYVLGRTNKDLHI